MTRAVGALFNGTRCFLVYTCRCMQLNLDFVFIYIPFVFRIYIYIHFVPISVFCMVWKASCTRLLSLAPRLNIPFNLAAKQEDVQANEAAGAQGIASGPWWRKRRDFRYQCCSPRRWVWLQDGLYRSWRGLIVTYGESIAGLGTNGAEYFIYWYWLFNTRGCCNAYIVIIMNSCLTLAIRRFQWCLWLFCFRYLFPRFHSPPFFWLLAHYLQINNNITILYKPEHWMCS